MTIKTFAPDVPRDEQGRLRFPPDNKRRRELFVPESFNHPARAHVLMIEALVEYLSEPGDLVVDVFGGSGTLLVGLLMGRDVTLMELSPDYANLCRANIRHIQNHPRVDPAAIGGIIESPNQTALPETCNVQAFIFSPPYAGALGTGGGNMSKFGSQSSTLLEAYQDKTQLQGNQTPYNLDNMSNFMFNQEMKKIYKLCLDALKPGGFTCCIIKDRIVQGVKDELGYRAMQDMLNLGYELYDWQRAFMLGSHYTKYHRSIGRKVIEEEHLIIMRKPA